MTFEDRAIRILAENFGVYPEHITRDTRLVDDLGADSLDNVELAMDLEDEFKIDEIPENCATEWGTVGELIDKIRKLSPES